MRTSLRSILEAQHLDPETIAFLLKKVKLQRFSSIASLSAALKLLLEAGKNILETHKVLLIEGLSKLFLAHSRVDKITYTTIYSCVDLLHRLAYEHKILILVTNIITTRNEVGWSESDYCANYTEVTGKEWPQHMDNRFLIHRHLMSEDKQLEIKILKSSNLKPGEKCHLRMGEQGLE